MLPENIQLLAHKITNSNKNNLLISLTFTKTCDNRQLGRVHAGAHEKDYIFVTSVAIGSNVESKSFQGGLGVLDVLQVKDLDSDVSEPLPLMD